MAQGSTFQKEEAVGELVPGKAPMSMDTLYWRLEAYALGQQNIPEEATALVIISKNGSQITFSSSVWKRLKGKKKKSCLYFLNFPQQLYITSRETI